MCDDRERLLGYLYNECDDAERRDVEQHLEGCETCRAELSGLRATRQDLLAWDVPEHGSVWKPFVPVKVVPRWRDIPAWAMAAAAAVTFVVGATGGVLTHAMLERNVAAAPAEQVAAKTPAQTAVPRAELSAADQRILRDMRAELASIQQQSARTLPTQLVGMRPQEVADRINLSERQQLDYISDVNNRLVQYKRETNARLESMARTLEMLTNALMSQQSGR